MEKKISPNSPTPLPLKPNRDGGFKPVGKKNEQLFGCKINFLEKLF